MNALAKIALGAVVLSLVTNAQAQEDRRYTVITGTGTVLFKLAIPAALDGGGAGPAARTVTDVMNRDMTLIGLFKVLDPKGFLADLQREGTGIDPQAWTSVGAQGVVKARAKRAGGKVTVEFYLYDVAKGSTPVLKKTYSGSSATRSVRRLAHKFGDDVVKFYTGDRGIFTTKIAFASANRKKGISNIYVMDYDGYGVYRVSKTGNQNVLPAFGPSGELAWTSFLWKNPDLYLYAGGRPRRISRHSGLNTGAAFNSRGEIALTLSKDGNAEIYVISKGGGILRRLTRNSAIDTSPAWAPGGGQLAFVSNRGGSPQIYVMSSSGGGARRLTFRGNYNQEPSWCPDPKNPLVAFTGRDEKGAYDIFTVNVSTGVVKRLTQGQGSNTSPSWAPNGKLLVFHSSRGGLWLMNADGLNQHQVAKGGETPSWSY